MTETILEKLSRVGPEPGVYLMKDAEERVIYVGKARNLRKRLSSYFHRPNPLDPKTAMLVQKVRDFEIVVTASEKEALILEANFIKRYKPKYNVVLKDDKRYLSIRLDLKDPYPALDLVRKIERDGALYFGPFSSAQAVRHTMKFINKTFKLRKCRIRDFRARTRPCLHCQMAGCLAPCCMDVDQNIYAEMVREVVLFLKGKTPLLIQKIKNEMVSAAEGEDFERAAKLRDKMFALEKTLEKQVAATGDFMDRDVLAIERSGDTTLVTLLFIRGGTLIGYRNFPFPDTLLGDGEILESFIRQYYENSPFIPKEILATTRLESTHLLEEWLKELKGEKVSIRFPERGEKARLIEMALQNAGKGLEEFLSTRETGGDRLLRLQKKLGLKRIPSRIECFDNSNLFGTEPVASVVVFIAGKADASAYRRYAIKTVRRPDDYATMAEVLKRRYGKGEASLPLADLIMVDGGKGQLNIALSILKELDLAGEMEVIGIAKKDERRGETLDKIFLPARVNPVNFGREGDLLLFLQKIRDEAHRFAIAYHRKRRGRTAVHSVLDDVPGIGKERKKRLLRHFGSVQKIRAATLEELNALPGMSRKAAEALQKALGTP
jgi:excinuclease ABC subunit C